jgi:hypothetical protein
VESVGDTCQAGITGYSRTSICGQKQKKKKKKKEEKKKAYKREVQKSPAFCAF